MVPPEPLPSPKQVSNQTAAGLQGGRLVWAALAISLAVIMSVMDSVMLNLALPSIAREFAVTPAESIWVVNAYQLAVVMALLPLGKMADVVGHRRVYLGCIALFGVASVGCTLSDSLLELSVMRFVQGCGGAGIMGMTNAMLRRVYPPHLLGRGIGTNGLIVAVALAVGPLVASSMVTYASWQWIFAINIPLAVVLLIMGGRVLPKSSRLSGSFDIASAVFSVATFGILIMGLSGVAHGEDWRLAAALLLAGVTLASLLIRHQRVHPAPLLPLDLLSISQFRFSVGAMFGASCAQLMAYVAVPFLFLDNLRMSQMEAGFLFMPWPLAIALVAPYVGRLTNVYPAKLLSACGLVLFSVGLLCMAVVPDGASFGNVVWRMALCGLAYGLFQPPNSKGLVVSVPMDRTASANALGATARVVGQSIGAAIVAMLFYAFPDAGAAAVLFGASLVALLSGTAGFISGVSLPLSGRVTGNKSASMD